MKIGNSKDQAALAAEALRQASESSKTKGTGTASSPTVSVTESTTVELSGASKMASGEYSAEGVFDSEKVARVQEAIANGTYVISPEGIASKLIANAKELLDNARAASTNNA